MKFLTLTFLILSIVTSSSGQELYPGKANDPETDVSAAYKYESKYLTVGDNKVHYIESGKGDPVIFLHGIPTWSYLWRNVVNKVDDNKRAIAPDFLGYGKSDFPLDKQVPLEAQYMMLKGFISQLGLKNLILVVNDLGSFVGLHYAAQHPENIKGIVMIEASYMPGEEWYKQLTFKQKMMVSMMKSEKRAKKMLVDKNMGGRKMVSMFTQRKLSDEEKEMYLMPFEEEDRRYAMINGPGPTEFPKKMISTEKGDMADVMNSFAKELTKATYPIHLIYAKPGMLVRKEAVEYARANFKNYSETYIGKGKHFVPESHPKAIAKAINKWYNSFN
ncbi:MAG: haloalkane dehalogenase [Cyclobacteriaceae bacterium]